MDPLSTIHTHLWGLADRRFTAEEIKPGNRIRLDQNKAAPQKRTVGHGDLPELYLIPTGGEYPLVVTSHHLEIKPQFQWMVATGNYELNSFLFPTHWKLILLLAEFQEKRGEVLFNDTKFVTNVSILQNDIGDADPSQNRGITGFATLITFEVTCRILRSIIDAES